MKTKHKALRCPCGCDAPVHPLIEVTYTKLRRHFGNNLKVVNGVNCKDTRYAHGSALNVTMRSVHNDRAQKVLIAHCRMFTDVPLVLLAKRGVVMTYEETDNTEEKHASFRK